MLFGYLSMHQCNGKAYSVVRRSHFFEEQSCNCCCCAIFGCHVVFALRRVETCPTVSLTRSISSLVEFTWLRIVLYFLPGNDMGNVDEIQYYFNEIEHSFKTKIAFKWKGLEEILLFIIFLYCRNIRGSIFTLYPSNDTSRCILLQLFKRRKGE